MRHIHTHILLILTAMLICLEAMGQDRRPTLVVQLTTGENWGIELAQRPVITFAEGLMSISSDDANTTFALSDVLGYHYENVEKDGILGVEPDVVLRLTAPDVYTLAGSKGALLHDATGALVKSYNCADQITIDLSCLPSGLYILTAHTPHISQSIKIIKR